MHAYLFISQNSDLKKEIDNLAKDINAKIMEFPISKVEDVRNLNNFLRLSFDKPTLVVCRNIHEAGDEALNAFLKNLEEPQENIYFAITATSARKVLPTIVSRCQIIKIANNKSQITNDEIENFFKMTTPEKIAFVDKIRDRDLAIKFAENMVNFAHGSLHQKELKYNMSVENIRLILKTLSGLKANGNVNLQLSNFVINFN